MLRRLLMGAAWRLAKDPELRRKTARVAEREVAPRLSRAMQQGGPLWRKLDRAAREAQKEAPAAEKPAEFAGALWRRVRKPPRGDAGE